MDLYVGQPAILGEITRYAERFDLLELRAEPGRLPRPAKLKAWAETVPERFAFSLMLPRSLAGLDSEKPAEPEVEAFLRSAAAIGARWIVLQTPPSATPSARTRRRLVALLERLPREPWAIAWEPRGLWEDPAAEALAAE